MKVRLLIDARSLGGVETHVINLCEELSERNYDCSIIFVRDYPNNVLYTLCDQKSISYRACTSYKELLALILQEKPNIIHAHGYKGNVLARLIGLITKTPIVTTFHSGEKPVGRLILYNFLDRWSSFISYNISVNEPIAAKLPFQSKIIPNFVAIPQASNQLKEQEPYNIYFIGRFSPEKGPLQFCQLATQMQENIHWHMVGAGPLLEKCKEVSKDRVYFHGQVTNMNALWPNVDLLCITSTYEGLPLVLLEAMSRGVPVISFDVGSIKEVNTEPEYIIPPNDLALMQGAILSHLKKSLSERRSMADRAREQIKKTFSTGVIVTQIESFYNGCVNSRSL